ncbi:hypothetical protein VTN77DRAFT_1931 [Rasamsonia byssochlamydoides]|uniref:uncharacterized protein n=1 Tax=Rasamsonia byssochlamydoides TaxID=89139 RepID=UPI003744600E
MGLSPSTTQRPLPSCRTKGLKIVYAVDANRSGVTRRVPQPGEQSESDNQLFCFSNLPGRDTCRPWPSTGHHVKRIVLLPVTAEDARVAFSVLWILPPLQRAAIEVRAEIE